jgi:hypothetical protein
MKKFTNELELARELLNKQFNEDKVDELFSKMKSNYEKLIPEMPYVGGIKNYLTNIMVEAVYCLAMFQVMEKEGLTLRDIGKFFYELCDLSANIRKNELLKTGINLSQIQFDPVNIDLRKKQCETSRLRRYPDDSVMDFVEGDGKTFEWGLNVYECGIQKIYKKLGAEKYVHLFCLADFSAANILGYGFSRTQTLGFGAPMCDHRYIKNYKTPKGWPPDKLPEYKEL